MMTFGQDLDAMYEARCAREWEKNNEDTEVPVYLIESELRNAWGECSDANDRLAWACEYAEGTPAENRIQSLIDDLEKIQGEIKKIEEEVKTL